MTARRLPDDPYNRCITFIYGSADEYFRYLSARHDGEQRIDPFAQGHWSVRVREDGDGE